MVLKFQEYVDAVKGLASNAAMDTGLAGNDEAKKLVTEYNTYLESKKSEGKGAKVESFENWATAEKMKEVLGEGDKSTAKKAAQDYLNNNDKVQAAKTDLFKDGAYAIEQAKGIGGQILDFLGKNMFTGIGLAVAAIAGNALGLGTLGTILLAVGGALAGGLLGDAKNGGFLGGLLGMGPETATGKAKEVTFIPAPGQTIVKDSMENLKPIEQFTGEAKFDTVEVKAYTPVAGQPDLTDRGVTKEITLKEKDGRIITYYGKMEDEKFVAMASRITETEREKATGTYEMKPPVEFAVKKEEAKTSIEFTTESSNAIINEANSVMADLELKRKAAAQAPGIKLAEEGKSVTQEELATLIDKEETKRTEQEKQVMQGLKDGYVILTPEAKDSNLGPVIYAKKAEDGKLTDIQVALDGNKMVKVEGEFNAAEPAKVLEAARSTDTNIAKPIQKDQALVDDIVAPLTRMNAPGASLDRG